MLVSGVVKTLGAVAAVFAVDPRPSPVFLTVLVLWIFVWEMGGQNIPNDWHDLTADRLGGARTLPVRYGADLSVRLVMGSLLASAMDSPPSPGRVRRALFPGP